MPRALRICAAAATCAVLAGLAVTIEHSPSAAAAAPAPGTINTFAGGLGSGDAVGVPQAPVGLAASGTTLYVSSLGVVRALDTNSGQETVIAGDGLTGDTGDGGPATLAELNFSYGLAADASGDVFIATNDRVRMVAPNGTITTVAGGGGYTSDGVPATSALLGQPEGVAVDSAGDLYIADAFADKVRRVDHGTGLISTVPGLGMLNRPEDVWVDGSGNLFVADYYNGVVREVASGTGTVSTVAGGGGGCAEPCSAKSEHLSTPSSLWMDGSGDLFIADAGTSEVHVVVGGTIHLVAGTGSAGYNGDGITATSAELNSPSGVAVIGAHLYVADYNNWRVREVVSGTITTAAGNGQTCGLFINGSLATDVELCKPTGVALDAAGDVFYLDDQSVGEVNTGGTISVVAGNHQTGYSGDGGPALSASMNYPLGLAIAANGDIYIADTGNNVVRKVSGGTMSTVAGNGTAGFSGDGGPATSAELNQPSNLAIDAAGNLYVNDSIDHRIREVTTGGVISTVVTALNPSGMAFDSQGDLIFGDGLSVYKRTPQGTVTTLMTGLQEVGSIAVGPDDRILVATTSFRVNLIHDGSYTLVAGGGTSKLDDGEPATSAAISPGDIAVDASGDIYVADIYTLRIRRVQAYTGPPPGTALTASVAGDNSVSLQWTSTGDGGLPITGYVVTPYVNGIAGAPINVSGSATSVTVLGTNNALDTYTVSGVNDWGTGPTSAISNTVEPRVAAHGAIGTHAGSVVNGNPLSIGQAPYSVAFGATNPAFPPDVLIGDVSNGVVRKIPGLTPGTETSIAGNGAIAYGGDGGPAVQAAMQGAGAIAYCGPGATYVADSYNYRIRRIDASGNITTVAGTGQRGYSGDDGPATSATISEVLGLSCRPEGGFYLSDSGNGAVRMVDENGIISTYWYGFGYPAGLVAFGSGYVDVADAGADIVYGLTTVDYTILAGNGKQGSSGDGGPATMAELNQPYGLACCVEGSLVIADSGNNKIRYLALGNIYTLAGTGAPGFAGDGGDSTAAQLDDPTGIAASDNPSMVEVADYGNHRVGRSWSSR